MVKAASDVYCDRRYRDRGNTAIEAIALSIRARAGRFFSAMPHGELEAWDGLLRDS